MWRDLRNSLGNVKIGYDVGLNPNSTYGNIDNKLKETGFGITAVPLTK